MRIVAEGLNYTYSAKSKFAVHALKDVSLTVEDIYRFQTYLETHSVTLMADDQKLPCICIG